MQDYADMDSMLEGNFNNYFRLGNSNRIVHHVGTGRVSPWIVYNCASGIAWLDALNEDQIAAVIAWIDPDFWQKKFKDYMADAEWVKDLLAKAGL
jgi:mono/diheme cytochrome c family protein